MTTAQIMAKTALLNLELMQMKDRAEQEVDEICSGRERHDYVKIIRIHTGKHGDVEGYARMYVFYFTVFYGAEAIAGFNDKDEAEWFAQKLCIRHGVKYEDVHRGRVPDGY